MILRLWAGLFVSKMLKCTDTHLVLGLAGLIGMECFPLEQVANQMWPIVMSGSGLFTTAEYLALQVITTCYVMPLCDLIHGF